jgi:3'(2'), 5'-bisphosphate nucleotidase
MHPFTKSQIAQIISLVQEAGEVAAKSFKAKDFEVTVKLDGSRVTSTDVRLSKFFEEKLSKISPYPIICEEGSLRKVDGDKFFVIDPIDGTSSFAKGEDQFCINIAFVENKKATFGIIGAPLFEGGKLVFSNEKNEVIDGISNKILSAKNYDHSRLKIVTSSRTKLEDIQNYTKKFYPHIQGDFSVTRLSSAVKFIKLLEGEVNLNLHLRPSMEWDTASGQNLVELMGGNLKKLSSTEGEFNIGLDMEYKKDDFINSAFIAYFKEISQ